MQEKKTSIRFFFILVLLLLYEKMNFCQEISYRHYTVRDGLAQNQVTNMFQDSKGYLWLGTKGGASRFDGLEFLNFTVGDGLVSNLITWIFENKAGDVYICSQKGVSRYNKGKIDTLFLSDTLTLYLAKSYLIMLSSSELLILNRNFLPSYFGHYNPSLISAVKILDERGITQIIYEKNYNKYWLRSLEDEIYTSKGDSVKLLFKGIKLYINKDNNGKILLNDAQSVYWPDTVRNRLEPIFQHISGEYDPRMQFDRRSRNIFSIAQKQIAIVEGEDISVHKKKFNFINQLFLDRHDNLWIATETGFYRQVSDAFENFTPEQGFPDYVWSIVEDNYHNIWFASYGSGLGKWDGNDFIRIDQNRNTYYFMEGNYFYTGALASKNNLLFPVKGEGILKYDGRKFEIIDGIPKGSVLDLYEDTRNQRILAASIAGLVIIEENKKPVLIQRNFNQSKNFLKTIARDKFGRYWLGGDFKITVMDGDEFIDLSGEPNRFNSGAISIFKDHRENLWIGTSSGLFFHDYNSFTKVAPDILRSQVVSFVEPDSSKLIMGVSEGLAMLNLEAFYRDGEVFVEILDEAKGFLGYDCIRNGILLDSDKNIWVAASDRVVKFYPDKLKKDTISPSVFIQKVIASGSKSNVQFTFSPMHENNTLFQVSHDLKDLRFDFHTIHYTAPEKIKYRYRLQGYDADWSEPISARYVTYTNLSPGKYTFQVKARNVDGVWSNEPAMVSFNIVPAFWQTITFRVIINILLISLILLVILIVMRKKRLRRQQQEMAEKQISEFQLKTIRSQMDPHFTFNALNSIGSVIYKEDKEKAYRYFVKFSKLVRSALEASDKIARSLQEEIDFTKNYLDLEKIRFLDKFYFQIDVDEKVDTKIQVPKMIIQSYAENAVKHGLKHLEDNRRLDILIQQQNRHLEVTIEDNGIGREQAALKNQDSTGKGLSIMGNIYDLYFKLYKIRIEQKIEDLFDPSGQPAGTRVTVVIPLDADQEM